MDLSRKLFAALAGLLIATSAPADEWISHISPDGHFAVHRFQEGGERETAQLIALPSRTEIVPLGNWAGELVWREDSRRFARAVEEGVHQVNVAIYERAGDSFKDVAVINDFPDSNSAGKGWPKEWRETGRDNQSIRPIRWLDADSLLLGVSRSVRLQKREESDFWCLTAQFTAKLRAKGKISKSPLTIRSRGFGDAGKRTPKLISDHIAEPRDWQVSPDRSVALVQAEGVLDLLEQRKEQVARVTHLHQRVEELFLADFRTCDAAPLNEEKPFSMAGDWWLKGADRVVIACEATTNPDGNQRSKMWCARLDAVWRIKEAKFIEQKVVRGFCGRLGKEESVRVAARSPSGGFRVELREQLDAHQRATGEYKAFVVPEKPDAGAETALEQNIRADDLPTYRISPDERSLYAEWGTGGTRYCTVFARNEGFRFVQTVTGPVHGEDTFDQAMWDFCRKRASLEPTTRRKCMFVAWAPDSSRVLISLHVSYKGRESEWKMYWNGGTRSFELTPFLEADNARALEANFPSDLEPYCAEPVGPLPSIEDLDHQLATARKVFIDDWSETRAAMKTRTEKEAPGTWPEIEKKAEAWRAETMAGIEKFAADFSRRWPESEREQWRRLSLAGGFRALPERVSREWPWGQ